MMRVMGRQHVVVHVVQDGDAGSVAMVVVAYHAWPCVVVHVVPCDDMDEDDNDVVHVVANGPHLEWDDDDDDSVVVVVVTWSWVVVPSMDDEHEHEHEVASCGDGACTGDGHAVHHHHHSGHLLPHHHHHHHHWLLLS